MKESKHKRIVLSLYELKELAAEALNSNEISFDYDEVDGICVYAFDVYKNKEEREEYELCELWDMLVEFLEKKFNISIEEKEMFLCNRKDFDDGVYFLSNPEE